MRNARALAVLGWLLASATMVAACDGGEEAAATDAPAELCTRSEGLDALVPAQSYAYAWTCTGEVPAASSPVEPTGSLTTTDDCTTGVWPDLDDTSDVCPTYSDVTETDPTSGRTLPSADARTLPTSIAVSEAGSFLPAELPSSWPATLRVVAWNMEYTAHLDDQIATLTSHPVLASADVLLLSEVDRCSTRNGGRRAARLLAEALEAQYVYGIEFVELDIGRDVGGDTGQAIVSRRPLFAAALTCHSQHNDWFDSDQPRLGQRVALHAEVPVGDTFARVFAAHLESNDLFGERRAVQSKEILDELQARACDRPQIVAGDLNAPYCGAPELQVLRDAGLSDAVGLAGDMAATHENGFRLDYVFTRGFRVVDGGVVRDLAASDHDPVWVDLVLD